MIAALIVGAVVGFILGVMAADRQNRREREFENWLAERAAMTEER